MITLPKFNSLFKVGTWVLTVGSSKWMQITEIDPTRQWVKLNEFAGSWQRNHIKRFKIKGE